MAEEENEDVSHLNEGVDLKYSENVEDLLGYLKSHPMFLDHAPTVAEIDKNPLLQGIQALKYNESNPLEYSEELKQEGNEFFKKKQYKKAIVSYSESIKQMDSVERTKSAKDFLAVLYTNRAASQYYLGNRRSAMIDATWALKANPDHFKALHRLCICFLELDYFEDCIKTCEVALTIAPDESKIKIMKEDANRKLKLKKRNERKEQLQIQKRKAILDAIASRGLKVKVKWPDESFAPVPTLEAASKVLSWPVTFFYPQFIECDFVESFDETCTFFDQLSLIFETPPVWDLNNSHVIKDLIVYYEDVQSSPRKPVLIKNPKVTLKHVLKQQEVVDDYQLSYFVLPKTNSKLIENFEAFFPKFKSKFREKFHSL